MADEITITASLAVKNGVVDEVLARVASQFDQTGTECAKFQQSIGTTEEAINLGVDIGTLGYILAINLDPTNFVSLRRATGEGNFIRLEANGGMALFKCSATAPFAIADTAACRVQFLILET